MATVPTLTVRLDNGTGTFPLDITSKVLSLEGYDISRGREDWIGAVTAGELSLRLNNSDGRFTPGSTILGTPSPITVDQRIRVSESVDVSGFGLGGFGVGGFGDAGSLVRFTGYVKSWPVTWPAVVTSFAEVDITATDAQARAERRTLRTTLEEELLVDGPRAYYTLTEPEGVTSASDSSGVGTVPLVLTGTGTAPTFGTGLGPGTDGLTTAQFTGGQYLAPATPVSVSAAAVEWWFSTTTNDSTHRGMFRTRSPVGGGGAWSAGYDPYLFSIQGGDFYLELNWSHVHVSDGALHHVLWVGTSVFLDDAFVGSVSTTPSDVPLYVGSSGGRAGGVAAGTFIGSMSHVVLYPTQPSDVRLTAHSTAATTGFAGETTTQRTARLAAYAGMTTGTLDTSTTTVPTQATAGVSAWEAIQEVADAEMGLVFVDGTGALAFHNRSHVTTKTAPDLTIDSQFLVSEVQAVVDDQQIVNYIEATSVGTGTTSIARNTASEAAHGRYPVTQDYLVTTDAEALARANWIVAKQAEPFTRYGTLTINLYKMTSTQATAVINALDLNCWLRVTSMASQNPGGTVADVVVQGWQENTTGESWSVTCNVVAKSLWNAFIANDPVYGIADSPLAPAFV